MGANRRSISGRRTAHPDIGRITTARINCFGQAHVPNGVSSAGTSGPHPRPAHTMYGGSTGAESYTRETF